MSEPVQPATKADDHRPTSDTGHRGNAPGAADGKPGRCPADFPAHRGQEGYPAKATAQEKLATEFADTFEPAEDVNYDWVYAYSKDLFGSLQTVFKELEDKASSTITFLGSGAGLLTMGAALAVANPSVDRTVVWWSLPSILCALAALTCALISRRPTACTYPPPITDAIQFAEYAKSEEKGKALFAAQYHKCVDGMLPVLDCKAFWVEWGLRLAVLSVALMLIPLLVGLGVSSKPTPPPIPAAAP